MPLATDGFGPENRVPYKLIPADGALRCQWMNIHNKRFDEPFFEDTALSLRILDLKNRQHPLVTPLHQMVQQAKSLDNLAPAVVIFHLSRCGSTLVSQLFAASERFIVLSEVPFFDEILRLPFYIPGVDETEIPVLFGSALNFYGRKRFSTEEHVMLKTDCWHIFFYELLRKMFPEVPFVLMYRNPGEILRSHLKIPGRQTVPELVKPEIFGLPGIPEQYNREIYTAAIIEKMLARFYEVAKADPNILLVNYNEGAMMMLKKTASFARLSLTAEEIRVMEERSRYHSKKPGELFNEEPAADVPDCLMEAMRLYKLLEEKRKML